MDQIIQKLNNIKNNKNAFNNWNLDEIQELLNIYLIISKKEKYIFDLIYQHHDSDTYEDIFRDYKSDYFDDKVAGIKEAIDLIKNKK